MIHKKPHESGQAAVEAALIIPMQIFLVLGLIQLTMLQQAQLMTQYAAYRAARAGIVNDGDCDLMKAAAGIAIMPTLPPLPLVGFGRTDTPTAFAEKYGAYFAVNVDGFNPMTYPGVNLDRLKIDIVQPKKSDLTNLFSTYGGEMDQKEIDYDDIRDATVVKANLLSIVVTYNYEMRIPFANALIHSWYIGAKNLNDIKLEIAQRSEGARFENTALTTAYLYKAQLDSQIVKLALGSALIGYPIYVIPLRATSTMRMQSNMYKSRMQPCAIDP